MDDLLPFAATYGLRLLHPVLHRLLWRGPRVPGRRTLYLTFDDGPTPDFTPRLLDLLERHEVPATFFLIGNRARRHPPLVRALDAAGHTVGHHTYTHPDAWRTAPSLVNREMRLTTTLLEDLTGHAIRHMRPPYGHVTYPMYRWCRSHEQHVVMWDVMPGDFQRQATAERTMRWIERPLRDGSVVVVHDNPIVSPTTPDALALLLPRLKAQGWRFAAL